MLVTFVLWDQWLIDGILDNIEEKIIIYNGFNKQKKIIRKINISELKIYFGLK